VTALPTVSIPPHEPSTAPTVDVERGASSWRALGTYVELRTTPEAVEAATYLAARVLDEVDLACSRFRDDSELMLANGAAGRAVEVSPLLVGAVRVALEAAEETDGLVDPLLGDVLCAAGYDRTFSLVPSDDPTAAALPVPAGSWPQMVVTDTTVTVPLGAALDLGATGKAFAADLVALCVVDTCDAPVLVSVGGDVRVAAPRDELQDQPVLVGHSLTDLEAGGASTLVRLGAGGLATSSVSARRWRRGGRQWHHVVDPRTGLPAQGPWRTVTALGRTAAAANAATTASIVLGAAAYDWLVDHDVAARLVDHDGHVTRTPAWTTSGIEETP
jgi:thiamine biosynthesis lipoprotein